VKVGGWRVLKYVHGIQLLYFVRFLLTRYTSAGNPFIFHSFAAAPCICCYFTLYSFHAFLFNCVIIPLHVPVGRRSRVR